MKLVAVVKNPASIARYLTWAGEPTDLPARSPDRGPPYWKSTVLRRRALGYEHVQTNEELYTGRSSRQPNRVFRNLGDGTFLDVSRECGPGFQLTGLHRGAAFGDLDDDGRIDAVVTRLNEPVEVFHNQTEPSGHFLLLKLAGTASNPDGLGASVRLVLGSGRSLVRHATTAVGYGGSRDKRVHFGLGREEAITRLEITWPGGRRQVLENVGVDRVLEIREPAAR